jgi:hypothetical protein
LDGIEWTHLLGGSGVLLAAGHGETEVAEQLGVDAGGGWVRVELEVAGELPGEFDGGGVGRREP